MDHCTEECWRNLFLLNHRGKAQKDCLWSRSCRVTQQDWTRTSSFFFFFFFHFLFFYSSLSHTRHRHSCCCCLQRPVFVMVICLHTHTTIVYLQWKPLGGDYSFFFPPVHSKTLGEADYVLSNTLISESENSLYK